MADHFDNITDLMQNGELDPWLDDIMAECRERKQVLSRMTFANLRKDDTIRITGNFKPRYLVGATATVEEKRVTKVVIRFPEDMDGHDPYGKYAGKRWVFPTSVIEKVEG